MLCLALAALPAIAWGEADKTSGEAEASAQAAPDVGASSAGLAFFDGRRAGIITGTYHDMVLEETFPDSPVSQYNNHTDMAAALKSSKIDFFLMSREAACSILESDDSLAMVEEPVRVLDVAALFAKTPRGDKLRAQMDEFIGKIQADGTLDEISAYWADPANQSEPVDTSGLSAENGTLQFATSGTKVPFTFVAGSGIAGTDADIAVRFCREYGYGIEVSIVEVAGIVPGIVSGRYDFAMADMVITEERKESVNFSVPYRDQVLLVVTRKDVLGDARGKTNEGGLLAGIASSFEKTFIREARWKLLVEGILTTLVITTLSILFGTALGFVVFLLCRNGNRVANAITRAFLALIQGTPVVVLLMILYYLVFGAISISGTSVAVIGFTLTFGAGVFGLLKMGVGAVKPGQYEAAYALGHSRWHTFFRIILPQAIPHVMDAYKGNIVTLIKSTSVVGYIAVQDLSKMGDIVRSRTYEAFFPLIAVTIVYFALEALFGLIVSRIDVSIDPKRRTKEQILKGVKTDA